MPKIWKISQFYGGNALDDKLGRQNQFADTSRNLDIYKSPGILRPHKAMEDDETGAADARITDFWAASDDKVYAVGKVGGAGGDKDYTRLYVKTDIDAAWGTATSGTGGTFTPSRMYEYKDYLFWWGKDNTVYSYGTLSSSPSISEAANSITATDQTGPMIEQKGNLYVAYDNSLASLDGSSMPDTTWDDNALDLPVGWLIKSLATWGKYIVIGAIYDSGYAKISKMFFWDTSASSWEFAKTLPSGELKGLRNVGDRIVGISFIDSFHASEEVGIAIWEWVGGEVKVVWRHSKVGATLIANDQIKDSEIDTKDNVFYFAANLKGDYRGLYSWGEPVPGAGKAFAFDRYSRLTANPVSYFLAAKFIGPYLYCSLADTTTGTDYVVTKTVNAVNYGTATSDGGIYDSLIFDGGKPYQNKEIKKIILSAKALPTNTSITLKYDADRTGTFTTVGTWTTATEKQKTFENISGVAFNKFRELQLRVEIKTTASSSGTPEITDITTLYDELEIPA